MIAWLQAYFAAALVLLAGALAFLATVRWGGPALGARPDRIVRWGRVSLALAVLLPFLLVGGGVTRWGPPALEIWSGPAASTLPAADPQVRVRWARAAITRPPDVEVGDGGVRIAAGLLLLGMALAAAGALASQRRLGRLCAGLPVVKRLGRLVLAAGPEGSGPFVARAHGLSYLVLPVSLFADPARRAMVLAHEAHHLRRGHVLAAHLLAALRAIFFWHPGVAWWGRALGELEDLACDRRALERTKSSAGAYGRCLLWAAQRAQGVPANALGMAGALHGSLRRRLTRLTQMRPDLPQGSDAPTPSGARADAALATTSSSGIRPPARRAELLALGTLTLVLATAGGLHCAVGTPQLSDDEVQAVAARITARADFPLVADPRIAEALNHRLHRPAWRERMRAGLARMPQHRATIEAALAQAGLPRELLAMVLSESAFDAQARTSRPPPRQAAGLWQLMPSTARRLGLTVTAERDDRLDPALASDAAARHLRDLYARYGDWPVAIAAYNAGAALIDRQAAPSIAETRERLLASEAEYGRYLHSVMISMLLIEEPALLE